MSKPSVFIVDDTPTNLGILISRLSSADFDVHVDTGGQSALEAIAYVQPDIILLDIMMPEIDGFEVCRRLKADPVTRDIPVIFMTALSDMVDEIRGLEAGAADYIAKPFQLETAFARIQTHLKARQMQQQLRDRNEQLQSEIIRRKRSEESLKESEEKYRNLVENMSDVVYILDPKGNILYVSPIIESFIGFISEEVIGRHINDFAYEDDLALLQEQFGKIISGQKARIVEYRLRKKNGEILWGRTSAHPNLRNGIVESVQGVLTDITDQKITEERLTNAKAFSDNIINAMPNPVFVKDDQHRWLILNDAFCNFMGYSRTELIGKSDYDFFPKEQADVFWEKDNMLFKSGNMQINEEDLTDSEGKVHTILTRKSVMTDADGKKILIGIITDITHRKQTEEALKKSERLMADIINFLPDAALVIDRTGRVISWNRAMEDMTGISTEEILGKGNYEHAIPFYGERRPILVDLVLDPVPDIEKTYPQIQRFDDVMIAENYYPNLRGKERWLVGKASVLRDSHGEIIGAIESVRDITERKRAEQTLLIEKERLRTILFSLRSGIIVVSQDNMVEYANPSFCELFRITDPPESLSGRTATEIREKIREPDSAEQRVREIIENNIPILGEDVLLESGKTIIRDFIPIVVYGKPCGRLWHHHDIT